MLKNSSVSNMSELRKLQRTFQTDLQDEVSEIQQLRGFVDEERGDNLLLKRYITELYLQKRARPNPVQTMKPAQQILLVQCAMRV